MEVGFVRATSQNLPEVDVTMVVNFFANNQDFLGTELRHYKTARSSSEKYGDQAVGKVQLKNDGPLITIRAQVQAEHRQKVKYNVSAVINGAEEKIDRLHCYGCVARAGGCKHAVAFLFWLLRRTEEPAPTSEVSYWRRAPLMNLTQQDVCGVEAFGEAVKKPPNEQSKNVLKNVHLLKDVTEADTPLSIHQLAVTYFESNDEANVNSFLAHCSEHMSDEACMRAEQDTLLQAACPLWHELRYGRITGSIAHAAARCSTSDGSLTNQILGATSFPETVFMAMGKTLEPAVLKEAATKFKMEISPCGLFLDKKYQIFGASPDGICNEVVVEVKCPSSEKTKKNYFMPGDIVAPKVFSQLQLEMLLANKKRSLLCVAARDFEVSKQTSYVWVDFDSSYIDNLLKNSSKFWEKEIFINLYNSCKL